MPKFMVEIGLLLFGSSSSSPVMDQPCGFLKYRQFSQTRSFIAYIPDIISRECVVVSGVLRSTVSSSASDRHRCHHCPSSWSQGTHVVWTWNQEDSHI